MFLFNSWEFVVAVVVAVLLSDGDLSDVTGNMERRMWGKPHRSGTYRRQYRRQKTTRAYPFVGEIQSHFLTFLDLMVDRRFQEKMVLFTKL